VTFGGGQLKPATRASMGDSWRAACRAVRPLSTSDWRGRSRQIASPNPSTSRAAKAERHAGLNSASLHQDGFDSERRAWAGGWLLTYRLKVFAILSLRRRSGVIK